MEKTIIFLSILFFMLLTACNSVSQSRSQEITKTVDKEINRSDEVIKSDTEWKNELTPMEYKVLRKAGTERAFSGDLWDHKGDGLYVCRGCQLPLFGSETKFKSGTGWPSYYQPLNDTCVETDTDYKIGYARTEVHCARCKGHLGHVFNDGPPPTGQRYCINSVSLDFVEREEK